MPGKITMDNVEIAFGSVTSTKAAQSLIDFLTLEFTALAKTVIANVPDCAHRSAALRDLLQAKMMCVDAIAKGGEV